MRIQQSILHVYPVGQKFRQNCSISHGLGDTSNFKFYHFWQKFENSKWPRFLERGKIFYELSRESCIYTLWAKNFAEIALSHTVLEIQAILCFMIFVKNYKIQNGRHFWREEIFLELMRVLSRDTLWVKNFVEIALSHTV